MILDSSAIVAVLLEEPDYPHIFDLIEKNACSVGAPTLVEVAIVLANRLSGDALSTLDRFLVLAEVDVIPFGPEHFSEARKAFVRYGKGRHPASLNYGDCLTYAVAKIAGEALLFKGDNFTQTDLVAR